MHTSNVVVGLAYHARCSRQVSSALLHEVHEGIEAVALDIAAEIGLLSHGDVDSADGQIRDLVTAANFRERPDRRRRTRAGPRDLEIGRASCRERVCQYV